MAPPTWFWMEQDREKIMGQPQRDLFLLRLNLKTQVKHYETDLMEAKLFGDKFGRGCCREVTNKAGTSVSLVSLTRL